MKGINEVVELWYHDATIRSKDAENWRHAVDDGMGCCKAPRMQMVFRFEKVTQDGVPGGW